MDSVPLRTVVLHGQGLDRRAWLPFLAEAGLDAASAVRCPDLLGHGSKAHRPPQDFDSFVEDLRRDVEATPKDPVLLIGHSLGAWVAARWAVLFPDEVVGLVLVAPALSLPPHFEAPFRALAVDLRSRGLPALFEFVDSARELWFPEPWASSHAAEIARILDIVRDQDADAQARVMEVLLDGPDCGPGLEALEHPVVILRGLADPTALTVTARPGDHVDLDGVGHFIVDQAPQVVREQIAATHMRATLLAMLRLQYRLRRPDLASRYRHAAYQRIDGNRALLEDGDEHLGALRRLLQGHDRIDFRIAAECVRGDRLFADISFQMDQEPASLYVLLAFRDRLLWRSYNDYDPLWWG